MKTFRIAHIFCGIGGKGLGAARAIARHGDIEARFETIGGIDFDPQACKDFEMLVGAPALCADVHELEPADLLRFLGPEAPDAIMMSPPCKGFSGLLSAKRAAEPKYQKMNALMERALFLVLSTWKTPPKLIFVENVPRIASRGKATIRRCIAMGHAHGYAIAEGTHDCGELGGLAQHRRRYFQLWRHRAQMPHVVYEPAKQRVRACGEVLGPLPMPGDVEAGGPMHSVPRLSWRNWLRLALIPAGGDWRDLPGVLADGQKRREKFRRDPVTGWDAPAETVTGPGGSASTNVADPRFGHVEKVTEWSEPVGTITRSPAPSSGAAAVADPRFALTCEPRAGAYGVLDFNEPADTVTGSQAVDNGRAAVADARAKDWYANVYRVNSWSEPAGTVTGAPKPSSGSIVVADPRVALPDSDSRHWNKYAVGDWNEPAPTVIGAIQVGSGAPSIADPRFGHTDRVTPWSDAVGTVTSSPAPSSGGGAVADPRYSNLMKVVGWDGATSTVVGARRPGSGALSVADPRWGGGRLGVTRWDEPSGVIAGESLPNNGKYSVADPRFADGKKKNWQQVSGVTAWNKPMQPVTSNAKLHAGPFQVADPRVDVIGDRYRIMTLAEARALDLDPKKPPPFIPIIIAEDGTWHRPLTTLELGVLQSFPATIDGRPLVLAGNSHTRWRQGIGNAVPPDAGEAISEQMLLTLLLAELGVRLEHLGLTGEGYPLHPLARGKSWIPLTREPEVWTP